MKACISLDEEGRMMTVADVTLSALFLWDSLRILLHAAVAKRENHGRGRARLTG
jgi:hypothetical protein